MVSENISGSIIWLRSALPVAGDRGDAQCCLYLSQRGHRSYPCTTRNENEHENTKRRHLPLTYTSYLLPSVDTASASDIYPMRYPLPSNGWGDLTLQLPCRLHQYACTQCTNRSFCSPVRAIPQPHRIVISYSTIHKTTSSIVDTIDEILPYRLIMITSSSTAP